MNTVYSVIPAAAPAVQTGYAVSDATLDQLKRGRITWGEANRVRDEVALTLEQQVTAAIQAKHAEMAALDNESLGRVFGRRAGRCP